MKRQWRTYATALVVALTAVVLGLEACESGTVALVLASFLLGLSLANELYVRRLRAKLQLEHERNAVLKRDVDWVERRAKESVVVLDLVLAGKWGEAEATALRWAQAEGVEERKAG